MEIARICMRKLPCTNLAEVDLLNIRSIHHKVTITSDLQALTSRSAELKKTSFFDQPSRPSLTSVCLTRVPPYARILLKFFIMSKTVKILVIEAKDLQAADFGGTSDPYGFCVHNQIT
jgi:hypothetical protein